MRLFVGSAVTDLCVKVLANIFIVSYVHAFNVKIPVFSVQALPFDLHVRLRGW